MKSSHTAVGIVGLALAGLWYFAGGTDPLPATRAAEAPQRVAAPISHENLSVYFVYGPDAVTDAKVMSLQEALDRELAVVHETSNVNVLAIENRSSEYELFVQSGDIVKGGKQDRMVQSDMLLPPKSGVVPLPAHCVEQGRWTGRGNEDSKRFSSSVKCAVGNDLKYANYAGQQSAVWKNVAENQTKLNASLNTTVNAAASPTSFQLTLESAALEARVAVYEAALKAAGEDRENVIGVVFAVNGQITGAEVYGSNALFRKAWPKLLNAAAVEAVADRTEASVASAPSAREVERFLAYGASEEPAGAEAMTTSNDSAAVALQELRRANRHGATNDNRETFVLGALNDADRSGPAQTRTGQFVVGGSVNSDVGLQTPIPAPNTDGVRLVNPRLVNPTRATLTAGMFGADGSATPQPPPPPVNNDANRLNSNRQENRSTLMVESRDAGRANAVIHRSYIKK